jgi:hypothetical protein
MIVTVIQTTIPRRRKQKKPVLNVPGKVAIYNGEIQFKHKIKAKHVYQN